MKMIKEHKNLSMKSLNQKELANINGGGIIDDFFYWLGKGIGKDLCGNVPEADYEAAMERWQRGSMY